MRVPGIQSALIGGILSLLPVGFLACTASPNAGGATDTETGGVIAGLVLDSSGNGAPGVPVTLIPLSHDPLRDEPLPDSHTVITDGKGKYKFTVDSKFGYNIYAERAADRTCFLHTGIMPDRNGTVQDTGMLTPTGYLMVILPDTVDTDNGYLYFKGTRIVNELKKIVPHGIGNYRVGFDALPASVMPPLVYAHRGSDSDEVVITPSLKIAESDSVVLEMTTATIRPLWKFSLLVGVKDTVSRHFGGITRITTLISNQLATATNAFTTAPCFNGTFLFAADSIYEYSGTAENEGSAPPHRFHYRLLYDTTCQLGSLNEAVRYSYIYLFDTRPDTLFGTRYTAYLTKLLGELRGALNLSWLLVDSSKNTVNNTAFPEIPSIMGNTLKYKIWDNYSASVINYNAGRVGSERDILTTAFTDTLGIVTTATNGTAVPGAEIRVYGILLNTRTVGNDPVLTGLTENNGRYSFPYNPFIADSTGSLVHGNLLIVAIASGDTTSAWFAVCEAGNAYFKNPAAPFYKELRF